MTAPAEPSRPDRPSGPSPAVTEQTIGARIGRALRRARLALAWEALWPRLIPLLAVAGLFVALSWFGLWRALPDVARYVVVALFGIGAALALVPPARLRLPGRASALARVEHATGAPHHPATAFSDKLAFGQNDPAAQAIWAAHRERLLASFGRLKAGLPAPGVGRRDPFALRYVLLLALGVGFVFAGGERVQRVAEAFRGPPPPLEADVARIDAWATPPAYTGRPPIFLTGDIIRPDGDGVITVPEGTEVTVRIAGAEGGLSVWTDGIAGPAEIAPAEAPAATADAPREHKIVLADQAGVAVRRGDATIEAWRFNVTADQPPQIAFKGEPTQAASGAIQLAYTLADDYGVVSAEARIARSEEDATAEGARPLVGPPGFELSLPRLRAKEGEGETTEELISHPWAGAEVRMTLVARDDAGQEGLSEPFDFTLPARAFSNPIARALVEQRRTLALDARRAPAVAAALDAITLAPEKFIPTKGAYLAIRAAYHRTIHARNDADLLEVVDFLWSIALGLEDGNLSLAAQNLRQAEEALRDALERGASEEEIARLTDELRQAMQEYLQAMAEQMQNQAQQDGQQQDGSQQSVDQSQLERMIDQIEQLAQSGATDAARQLLNELQNMMENMQAGQQPNMQQGQSQMGQALEQLGQMIQRQQELMDQTFSFNQRGNEPGQGPLSQEDAEEFMRHLHEGEPGQQKLEGQTPLTEEEIQQFLENFRRGREQRNEQLGELTQGQRELQQQLEQLMQQMQEQGMDPGEQLGQAGEEMGSATEQLGQGKPSMALGEQGQALEQLRAGAQAMAEQLAQQQGLQPGQQRGRQNQARGDNEDPLGRPLRNEGPDFGTQVKVPDQIDVQRAREILETIRRRLGEIGRPLNERSYLERLLQRY